MAGMFILGGCASPEKELQDAVEEQFETLVRGDGYTAHQAYTRQCQEELTVDFVQYEADGYHSNYHGADWDHAGMEADIDDGVADVQHTTVLDGEERGGLAGRWIVQEDQWRNDEC